MITIQSTLAPDSAGTEVDQPPRCRAARSSPRPDLLWDPDNFADNGDSVSFTPGTVDVGITKSVVGSSTVAVGDVGTFRLVASNSGTLPARTSW